jgi:hypothetical protein
LPGLHLRSHQTNFIDPGAVRDIDRLGNPLEIDGRVALDEDDALCAGLENLLETSTQLRLIGRFTIDGNVVIGINRDDHRTLIRLVRLRIRRRRLGHESLKSLRRKRRDHHENDDENQQHVDHRRHVDVGFNATRPANGH